MTIFLYCIQSWCIGTIMELEINGIFRESCWRLSTIEKNKEKKKHLWSRESRSGILFSGSRGRASCGELLFRPAPACILHSKPGRNPWKGCANIRGEQMARESGARRRRRRAEDVREGDQNLEAVYVTTTAGCCHLFSSSPTPVESSFIIQKVNFEWVEGDLFTEVNLEKC